MFQRLPALAFNFINVLCKIAIDDPRYNCRFVMEEVCKYHKPTTAIEEMHRLLFPILTPDILTKIMQLTAEHAIEYSNRFHMNTNHVVPGATVLINEPIIQRQIEPRAEEPKKRKRVTGNEDLVLRKTLQSMKSGGEKLALILQIDETMPEDSLLTNGARDYKQKVSKNILFCLNEHFNGDKGKFCDKWGVFSHSTFDTKCCSMKKPCTK